ncbi:S8 family peptidase [Pseudomonas oryzae]|uniref:Subtilase family protein n=1 Tax=Pseudomonas oryzae TaxID=1392877 RepID=A0A1H1XB28_9PSED|nr:S8 family peptidase [Pseudomonas oryzae]SDT06310.1 Subtilase family protein [Pseudomonas oryzae]
MSHLSKGFLLLCLGGLPLFAQAGGNLPAVRQSLQAGRPHVANELLVQFRPEASASSQRLVLGRFGAEALERLQTRGEGRGELLRVRLSGTTRLSVGLLERIAADSSVAFAEPNWIYQRQANPDDPYLSNLWGMLGAATAPANANGSGALALWNAGLRCDSQVVVGIIDEGLMVSHPDLQANVWVNPGEYGKTVGVDDDGNGYVDDIHGWDFNGKDASVYDGSADDHGSHVAGSVAASIDNGLGVFGVCPTAKLISAKFLGPRGGTTANAVKAVQYLTDLKQRHGLRLVASNNSWGGGGYSQALADAIAVAGAANILFIAAAGNAGQNIDTTPSYPASYPLANLLAVAAIDKSGAKASFSNWGVNTVAIAAPGVDILSTVPTRKGLAGYAAYSGTSMATPHVTGAAALYAALNPCASAVQIKSALLVQAATDSKLAGQVQNGRRLDVTGFSAELGCR